MHCLISISLYLNKLMPLVYSTLQLSQPHQKVYHSYLHQARESTRDDNAIKVLLADKHEPTSLQHYTVCTAYHVRTECRVRMQSCGRIESLQLVKYMFETSCYWLHWAVKTIKKENRIEVLHPCRRTLRTCLKDESS